MFLIDGTYELFRQFFGRPGHITKDLVEVDAVRGVLGSMLQLIEEGVTHIGVATDHVVESFRNDLYAGYKTGAGVQPELKTQFPILEDALVAMGVVTWPMKEHEADDGLAAAARISRNDERVEQVVICTPDKDLGQCVDGSYVVQVDRRKNLVTNEEGVIAKFGVAPSSLPDYLALVGDSADGFPGIPGWGAKSTAAVLAEYRHIENIPAEVTDWTVTVRGAAALASALVAGHHDALLFKDLATLRDDMALFDNVDELRWTGPTVEFAAMCESLEAPRLLERAERLAVGGHRTSQSL